MIDIERLAETSRLFGCRWVPLILWELCKGTKRFNQLHSAVRGVSQRMLSRHLKELEKEGILKRKLFPEVPPRVEYTLTPKGQTLLPILTAMKNWAEREELPQRRAETKAPPPLSPPVKKEPRPPQPDTFEPEID